MTALSAQVGCSSWSKAVIGLVHCSLENLATWPHAWDWIGALVLPFRNLLIPGAPSSPFSSSSSLYGRSGKVVRSQGSRKLPLAEFLEI